MLTASVILVNVILWTLTVSPNDAGIALVNASGTIGAARLILKTRSSTSSVLTSTPTAVDASIGFQGRSNLPEAIEMTASI